MDKVQTNVFMTFRNRIPHKQVSCRVLQSNYHLEINNSMINLEINNSMINLEINNLMINLEINNSMINLEINNSMINLEINNSMIHLEINNSIINLEINNSMINYVKGVHTYANQGFRSASFYSHRGNVKKIFYYINHIYIINGILQITQWRITKTCVKKFLLFFYHVKC